MSTQRNFNYNPYPEYRGNKKSTSTSCHNNTATIVNGSSHTRSNSLNSTTNTSNNSSFSSSSNHQNNNYNNYNNTSSHHHSHHNNINLYNTSTTSNDNGSDNDSSSNHHHHHRMNQHSLQQRGMYSSHRQSPSNTPERQKSKFRSNYMMSNPGNGNGNGSGVSGGVSLNGNVIMSNAMLMNGNGNGNTSNGDISTNMNASNVSNKYNSNGNGNGNSGEENYNNYDPDRINHSGEGNAYHQQHHHQPSSHHQHNGGEYNKGGGPFTPPRPISSSSSNTTSTRYHSQNQNQNHNNGESADKSIIHNTTTMMNNNTSSSESLDKIPTPVITAKNARNFWKSKVEKPIKIWKKPLKNVAATTAAAAAVTNHDMNHHITAQPSSSTIASTTSINSPSKHSTTSSKSSGVFSNINSRGTNESQSHNNQSNSHSNSQSNANSHLNSSLSSSSHGVNHNNNIIEKNRQIKFRKKILSNNNNHQQQQQQQQQHCDNTHNGGNIPQHSQQHSQQHPQQYTKNNISQQHHHQPQQQFQEKSSNFHDKGKGNMHSPSNDPAIGEMQIKLDIAAAQLLTEEMKYKDLHEQYRKSQDDYEEKISVLSTNLHRLKREEHGNKDKYSVHVKELERDLDDAREVIQNYEEQHKQQDSKDLLHQNEELKLIVDTQKNELNELCMEIQRLHDSHKADAGISNHKMQNIEKKKNDEIARLTMLLEEQKTNKKSDNDEVDLVKIKYNQLCHDVGKLAEENDRLEKELEAVTEDRDGLLRRSVLYNNNAAAASATTDGKINSPEEKARKRIASSISESSVQGYELQQVRDALDESESIRQRYESRIQELEKLVLQHGNSTKDMDSLDLSGIDLESTSFLSMEKQGKISSLEELHRVQKECTQYKRDAIDAHNRINKIEKEKEELRECLNDAMNEVEKLEGDKVETQQRHEEFTQELTQIIKVRDAEIENLRGNGKNNNSADGGDADASDLREELLNMVEWLNSSNRINGSPSIECMLTEDPPTYIEQENEQPFDELNNDDPALQSVYKHVKQLQSRLKSAEAEIQQLKEAKGQANVQDTDTPIDNQSLNLAAEQACQELWKMLNDIEVIDDSTNAEVFMSNLRSLLQQTADLIMVLKKQNLALAKNRPGGTNEMDEKDDEITQLKIVLGQLREELQEKNEQISNKHGNGELEEMPTPTKSNRSTRRKKEFDSSLLNSAQYSNEEDDVRARMAQSELIRLQNDLKTKINTEETLKTIIRDHKSRITSATAEAEALAQEKSELVQAMKGLEKQKVVLEEDLKKAHIEITLLNEKMDNHPGGENAEKQSEVESIKLQLKAVSKERKKLKKSLAEAVEMLNALQEHVLTAEKERKKMKKQLKSVLASSNLNKSADSKLSESEITEDADQMENQTIILQLKSHIVALDHEIRTLNERIDELDSLKTKDQSNGDQIAKLNKELKDAMSAYEKTKSMYDEVVAVNKELLNDLKATEEEEAETIEELESLKRQFHSKQSQIDTAISVASASLKKLDSAHQGLDPANSVVDLIKRLAMCSERALEEKNMMLLELLGERK